MSDFSFGDPIPVTELPPTGRAGRQSKEPAFREWLAKLQPNQTYELPSENAPEDAGEFAGQPVGHPLSRVQALRKVAGEGFKVDTRTLDGANGKRYRIFVTIATADGKKVPNANASAAKK